MNLLAIDYGTKRIGLAWVNTMIDVVLPFGVISNQKSVISDLVELIKKERIDRIVVGLPLGLDGKENDNTKRVRLFIERLKSVVRSPIITMDERFTTAEAKRLGEEGVSVDERAAMVILQAYLDRR